MTAEQAIDQYSRWGESKREFSGQTAEHTEEIEEECLVSCGEIK